MISRTELEKHHARYRKHISPQLAYMVANYIGHDRLIEASKEDLDYLNNIPLQTWKTLADNLFFYFSYMPHDAPNKTPAERTCLLKAAARYFIFDIYPTMPKTLRKYPKLRLNAAMIIKPPKFNRTDWDISSLQQIMEPSSTRFFELVSQEIQDLLVNNGNEKAYYQLADYMTALEIYNYILHWKLMSGYGASAPAVLTDELIDWIDDKKLMFVVIPELIERIYQIILPLFEPVE